MSTCEQKAMNTVSLRIDSAHLNQLRPVIIELDMAVLLKYDSNRKKPSLDPIFLCSIGSFGRSLGQTVLGSKGIISTWPALYSQY